MIMVRTNLIALLLAFICIGPISNPFTVICYGSDGHIAMEPIFHNHCECPKADENTIQKDCSSSSILLSYHHSHCKDSPLTSSVVVSARKNIKLQLAKVFVQGFYQKSTSNHVTSSFRSPVLWGTELSSFFMPLRTIILLA